MLILSPLLCASRWNSTKSLAQNRQITKQHDWSGGWPRYCEEADFGALGLRSCMSSGPQMSNKLCDVPIDFLTPWRICGWVWSKHTSDSKLDRSSKTENLFLLDFSWFLHELPYSKIMAVPWAGTQFGWLLSHAHGLQPSQHLRERFCISSTSSKLPHRWGTMRKIPIYKYKCPTNHSKIHKRHLYNIYNYIYIYVYINIYIYIYIYIYIHIIFLRGKWRVADTDRLLSSLGSTGSLRCAKSSCAKNSHRTFECQA